MVTAMSNIARAEKRPILYQSYRLHSTLNWPDLYGGCSLSLLELGSLLLEPSDTIDILLQFYSR